MYKVVYFSGHNRDIKVYDAINKQDACSHAIRVSKWADIAIVYENDKLLFMYSNGIKH